MGYSFECRNLVPDCDGVVTGETPNEVLEKAAAHAAEVHGLTELDGETVATVRAGIAETA